MHMAGECTIHWKISRYSYELKYVINMSDHRFTDSNESASADWHFASVTDVIVNNM